MESNFCFVKNENTILFHKFKVCNGNMFYVVSMEVKNSKHNEIFFSLCNCATKLCVRCILIFPPHLCHEIGFHCAFVQGVIWEYC